MGVILNLTHFVTVYAALYVITLKYTNSNNITITNTLRGKRLVQQHYCSNQILAEARRYRTLQTRSKLECVAECSRDQNCKSIVFDPKVRLCQLGDAKAADNCSNMEPPASATVSFYQEPPPCGYGEEMGPMGLCICAKGFTGVPCQRYFHDCRDAMLYTNDTRENAFHTVSPLKASAPFKVKCRRLYFTRTYIMDRRKGNVNFTRPWAEYRDGFGNVEDGDFWLGLDKIYALTYDRDQELIFNIKVQNNSNKLLNYSHFRISDEATGYKLYFNQSVMDRTNDCLTPLNGAKFSTYDRDRDGDQSVDCAEKRKGGFWFRGSVNCSACNPTGILYKPTTGRRLWFDDEAFWASVLGETAMFKVSMYLLPIL